MPESTLPLRESSRVAIVMGIAVMILGALAIMAPMFSGIAVTTLTAVILIAAGIARLIFAFRAGSFGRGFLRFVFGLLTIGAGILMLVRPLLSLASITLILIVYLLFDGVIEIVAAFQAKPLKGWGWLLVSGIAALLLGVLLAWGWPVSGAWAVGILLGIHLIFAGSTMVAAGSVGESIAGRTGNAVGHSA